MEKSEVSLLVKVPYLLFIKQSFYINNNRFQSMPMVIPNSKQQQQDRKLHPRLNHAFNTDIKASQHVKRPFEQSISLGKQETITTKGNQQEIFYPEPEEKVLSSEYDLPESFEDLNQDFEGKDSLVFSTACEDIWFRFTQEKIFSSSVSSQQ